MLIQEFFIIVRQCRLILESESETNTEMMVENFIETGNKWFLKTG